MKHIFYSVSKIALLCVFALLSNCKKEVVEELPISKKVMEMPSGAFAELQSEAQGSALDRDIMARKCLSIHTTTGFVV
jgi:uncharacterized membrane protein